MPTDFKNEANPFGFDDIMSVNIDELEEVKQREEQIQKVSATQGDLQSRLDQLYQAIQPLLNNLKKDADKKDYIYFPGRGPKIESFESHLANIYYGK